VLSNFKSKFAVDWAPFLNAKWTDAADTNVPLDELKRLSERITSVPEGFKLHPTVARVIEARKQMAEGKQAVDWGMAETLAYASLLSNGYDVRLSGQDMGRGTFAHRHAGAARPGSRALGPGQLHPAAAHRQGPGRLRRHRLGTVGRSGARLRVRLLHRRADRAGGVGSAVRRLRQRRAGGDGPVHLLRRDQVGRVCGLVQLLPHGYEGQGPEHSSARLERYLQLCAEHNMQVCVPSNAAQIFHLLRRQMLRPFRKPLIVMTPKSLLRKKEAASSIQELANGVFQTVIPDTTTADEKGVKRVIACCGKVYYDLATKRIETQRADVAIIRVEQLYPFPHKQFQAEIAKYPNATEVVWCQEEPQNQGAWYQTAHYLRENMREGQKLYYAGRPASASPAGGYKARHDERQKALVEQAFGKYK
jgi:2-oxoglutarate dehydrogenase E1 component